MLLSEYHEGEPNSTRYKGNRHDNGATIAPFFSSSFIVVCGLATWRPQCLKKKLRVQGKFAVKGGTISRAWMNELKVRCVESETSNSLIQRF